jgi:hypothetical protein
MLVGLLYDYHWLFGSKCDKSWLINPPNSLGLHAKVKKNYVISFTLPLTFPNCRLMVLINSTHIPISKSFTFYVEDYYYHKTWGYSFFNEAIVNCKKLLMFI